jgi:hypothetical protein
VQPRCLADPLLSSEVSCRRQAVQILQHLFRVSLGLDVIKHVHNLSIGPNDKGRPRDALHFLAIHIFFFDNAERLADLLVGIRQ